MGAHTEEWLQKLNDHLERVGDWTRGYGWKAYVNRKLNRSPTYVHQGLRRKNLQVSTVFSVLTTLGQDIPHFLANLSGASGRLDSLARLTQHGQQLEPELPAGVVALRKRLDELPTPPGTELSAEDQALVQEISDGRYLDPHRAIATAEQAIGRLRGVCDPEGLRPAIPILAEWASAKRRCDDPDAALWVLLHCLRWHRPTTDFARKGDLLQRLAHCYSDHFADYEGALNLSDRALSEHTMARSPAGIGRTLVDRGVWLFYLGRYAESLHAYELALEHLPSTEVRHRTASYFNQARGWRALGCTEHMVRAIEEARAIAPKGLHRANLRWLEGTVAAEQNRFAEAEAAFLECCKAYEATSPVNTALVALELVRLYVQTGRLPEARKTAKRMARLVWPLRRFPLAEAAVSRLVLKADQAQLSEKLLLTTRNTILRARVQRFRPTHAPPAT